MYEIFSHPIVALLVMLGALVLVHEYGHYIVGKWCGIPVEVFSIGFGPVLLRWRKGYTDYQLCLLPLGGYVKFYGALPGEEVPDELRGQEMFRAAVWRRFLAVAAGPVANFLMAWLIFSGMGWIGIKHPPADIGFIRSGGAAEQAGLQVGDRVLAINGSEVKHWSDMRRSIINSPDQPLNLEVERLGEEVTILMTPEATEVIGVTGQKETQGRAGVAPSVEPPIVVPLTGSDAPFKSTPALQAGDRIVSVGGQAIGSMHQLKAALAAWKKGLEASLVDGKKNEAGFKDVRLDWEAKRAVGDAKKGTDKTIRGYWSASESFDAKELEQGLSTDSAFGYRSALLCVKEVRSTAAHALQPGDCLLEMQGASIVDIFSLSDMLQDNRRADVEWVVLREGQRLTVQTKLEPFEAQLPEGKVTLYQLDADFIAQLEQPEMVTERYTDPIGVVGFGLDLLVEKSGVILSGLFGLFTGSVPMQSLGGPILIAKVAGDSARLGLEAFLVTLALISLNVGWVNLLPIPVLDGGRLVMLAAEKVKGSALSMTAVENFHKIGFALVFSLMILAMYNDISRFWSDILRGISP